MKKTNKKLETVVKKVVNHMVDKELYGWPPQCASFLYQPVRPQSAGKIVPGGNQKSRK